MLTDAHQIMEGYKLVFIFRRSLIDCAPIRNQPLRGEHCCGARVGEICPTVTPSKINQALGFDA